MRTRNKERFQWKGSQWYLLINVDWRKIILGRRNKIKWENAGSDPRMEIIWPGQNYMWGRNIWMGDLVLSKKTTYSCSSMIYRWPEKKKEIMQLFKYSWLFNQHSRVLTESWSSSCVRCDSGLHPAACFPASLQCGSRLM